MTSDPRHVDGRKDPARFRGMGFDRFRELALDPCLTDIEKMGGAQGHREGYDAAIWASMISLLPALSAKGARILDIGPGCGEIARRMIRQAETQRNRLTLVDHKEMLDLLPVSDAVDRIEGRFPEAMQSVTGQGYDAVIAYSVLHYVVVDSNPFAFVDAAMGWLNPGGRLLVGDLPNLSKLRRFLASDTGIAFHKAYMRTEEPPVVPAFAQPDGSLDDSLLIGLMMRARNAGFDAYLLPQPPDLALANRREDLLVVRP